MTDRPFLHRLMDVPFGDRDAWVDALLSLDAPPADGLDLPRGAVPYVPCGVDAIIHTVASAPVTDNDVFVDLGAGVGRVCLLVHLMTGARAIGVEIQPRLVDEARAHAKALALPGVTFHCADAALMSIPEGSIFFIYASFPLVVLKQVLLRLRDIASSKPIIVCAVGFDIHDEPWLTARESSSVELAIYDSSFTR